MEGLPTPVFWPGELHRLYSLWDRKELDMTERLSLQITARFNPKFCKMGIIHKALNKPFSAFQHQKFYRFYFWDGI